MLKPGKEAVDHFVQATINECESTITVADDLINANDMPPSDIKVLKRLRADAVIKLQRFRELQAQ